MSHTSRTHDALHQVPSLAALAKQRNAAVRTAGAAGVSSRSTRRCSFRVGSRKVARPVTGLGSADFELTDNGVPQEVSAAPAEALAVDVTLAPSTPAAA